MREGSVKASLDAQFLTPEHTPLHLTRSYTSCDAVGPAPLGVRPAPIGRRRAHPALNF